jgi:hypothetical protein
MALDPDPGFIPKCWIQFMLDPICFESETLLVDQFK